MNSSCDPVALLNYPPLNRTRILLSSLFFSFVLSLNPNKQRIVPQKYDGDTHRFAFQVVSKERGWEFAFSSVDLRDEWLKLLVDLVIFVRGGGGGDSSNLAAVQLDHLS